MLAADQTLLLLEILKTQPAAALGTLHQGEPFVSMVPFALLPQAGAFVIHVSALAAHTKDMLASDAVSLMVMALPQPHGLPQGLARATFQCRARKLTPDDAVFEAARRSYLARFPQSQELFSFGDFSLFALEPRYMRLVGGFGQATTVMSTELLPLLAQAQPSAE